MGQSMDVVSLLASWSQPLSWPGQGDRVNHIIHSFDEALKIEAISLREHAEDSSVCILWVHGGAVIAKELTKKHWGTSRCSCFCGDTAGGEWPTIRRKDLWKYKRSLEQIHWQEHSLRFSDSWCCFCWVYYIILNHIVSYVRHIHTSYMHMDIHVAIYHSCVL